MHFIEREMAAAHGPATMQAFALKPYADTAARGRSALPAVLVIALAAGTVTRGVGIAEGSTMFRVARESGQEHHARCHGAGRCFDEIACRGV